MILTIDANTEFLYQKTIPSTSVFPIPLRYLHVFVIVYYKTSVYLKASCSDVFSCHITTSVLFIVEPIFLYLSILYQYIKKPPVFNDSRKLRLSEKVFGSLKDLEGACAADVRKTHYLSLPAPDSCAPWDITHSLPAQWPDITINGLSVASAENEAGL